MVAKILILGFLFSALCCLAPGAELEKLVTALESVEESTPHVYRLRDADERGLDCLEVFQPAGGKYNGVYGVHHSRESGVFSVHLVHSMDLVKWKHLRAIDKHASQATIYVTRGGGFLLAYEKDAPNSCWIRVRFYKDLAALKTGTCSKEVDLPRSLAPTAEGTPSFESVVLDPDDLEASEIVLRFHYFENTVVDQLARGTLKGFKNWEAEPSKILNHQLKAQGGRGNLGDRGKFVWNRRTLYLQEVQGRRGVWESWGVFLCDETGLPLCRLKVRTRAGATAFSNPSATWFSDKAGERRLAVSMFLPSEGSEPRESGQLLYVIDPDS